MKRALAILLLLAASASAQTKLYMRSATSVLGATATGGAQGGCGNGSNNWVWRQAVTSSGTETSGAFAPANGSSPPCLPQTASGGGDYLRWISPPVSSPINLTGNYDYSFKCNESATALNSGFRFVVYRWSALKGAIDLTLDTSAAGATECGGSTYTIAAHAPSCGSSCNLAAGDRIVVTLEVQAVGGGFGANGSRTVTLYYEGANTFANFAQSIGFSADSNNARTVVQ